MEFDACGGETIRNACGRGDEVMTIIISSHSLLSLDCGEAAGNVATQ
jgi:hypothetical protein